MGLFRRSKAVEERSTTGIYPLSWEAVQGYFQFLGNMYPYGYNQTAPGKKQEDIGYGFCSLAQGAFKQNGPVFACMLVRMLLFAEAKFSFRKIQNGRPGDYFSADGRGSSRGLEMLRHPWPGGTTSDLLSRAIQDADLAGNSFWVRRGSRLKRLRPDWVYIVIADEYEDDSDKWDVDAEVLGYVYQPGGPGSGKPPEVFLPGEVAHFAPIPDPEATFRGMSWLQPVIGDIMGDKALTQHKLEHLEKGGTVNLAISLKDVNPEQFNRWVEAFKAAHPANANRTAFFGAGADVKTIGSTLEQLQYTSTQGAGETRIAAAAGVPPVIIGLSEGLAAATYSNYEQALRRLTDLTMHPLWTNFTSSIEHLIDVPQGMVLAHDVRDTPALQDNVKDAAEAQQIQAATMSTLIDAGYEPDSVTDAVTGGDLTRLKHTKLVSVQLHEPGADPNPVNGNGMPALPTPQE